MEQVNGSKSPHESLGKEELVKKYKSLLVIAKKAKQAKDELSEENLTLKEALRQSDMSRADERKTQRAMQEMLEEITNNKLQQEMKINELQNQCAKLEIERESLQRQLHRLGEENDELLVNVECMDSQLKKVNVLSKRQKEHLQALEQEVNRLKENETIALQENVLLRQDNDALNKQVVNMTEKYEGAKQIGGEQRKKFRYLKERFLEMHRKLVALKECKKVLLETHQDYHCSVTKWQKEIANAAQLMNAQMDLLKKENDNLSLSLLCKSGADLDLKSFQLKIKQLIQLSEAAQQEHADMGLTQVSRVKETTTKEGNEILSNIDLIQSENILKKLEIELLSCNQSKENLLKRLEFQEKEHAQTLDELEELKNLLRNAENNMEQTLCKELNHTNLKLHELEQKLSSRENEIVAKTTQLLQVNETVAECQSKLTKMQHVLQSHKEVGTSTESPDVSQSPSLDFKKVCAELEDVKEKWLAAQTALDKSKSALETLKTENQKLKTMNKQSNVLNLEIEAAEKSLEELASKLSSKSNELYALKEVLTLKENTIGRLEQEINILEAAKQAELTHSLELKRQIDHLHENLKDAVHAKQRVLTDMKTKEQTIEQLTKDLRSAQQSRAENIKTHENALVSYAESKDQLQYKLNEVISVLQSTETKLRTAEQELSELRTEYADYKIKAQAVLRNNQHKDSPKEYELKQELLTLQTYEKQLRASVDANLSKLQDKDKQIELLKEDLDKMQTREQDFTLELSVLRTQNEKLNQENQHLLQLQKDSLTNHHEYIKQMEQMNSQKVNELLNQIESLKKAYTKETRIPPTVGAPKNHIASTLDASSNSASIPLDLLLMEREDAEGSEEAATYQRKLSRSSRNTQLDVLPLEDLLNTPMDAVQCDIMRTRDDSRHSSDEDGIDKENFYMELQKTKDRLRTQESRVRHLTSLLSENEQDLAKLTQMNDMLKEELRRQDRGVEREKHMHNSEYLKNIVFKFATLSNSDEKARLIPVLSTILKLNPTETEALNTAVKGPNALSSNIGKSWNNILQSWSKN